MGCGTAPCPAWWYHEGPGRPHERCPACHARRRWLVAERVKKCICGKILLHPKRGRPRVTCSARCYGIAKRLLRSFA
jgi:hypothetical protein